MPSRDDNRALRQKRRQQMITVLDGRCKQCGISDPRVLEIDHIYNDGYVDRSRMSLKQQFQDVLDYPKRYQLLCLNCHRVKTLESAGIAWIPRVRRPNARHAAAVERAKLVLELVSYEPEPLIKAVARIVEHLNIPPNIVYKVLADLGYRKELIVTKLGGKGNAKCIQRSAAH